MDGTETMTSKYVQQWARDLRNREMRRQRLFVRVGEAKVREWEHMISMYQFPNPIQPGPSVGFGDLEVLAILELMATAKETQ